MSKTKRMIYIREENLDFYDSLENKSDFINEALKLARLGGVDSLKVEEAGEEETVGGAEGPVGDVIDAVEAMRRRDAARLAEYRKKNGLYDPTKG